MILPFGQMQLTIMCYGLQKVTVEAGFRVGDDGGGGFGGGRRGGRGGRGGGRGYGDEGNCNDTSYKILHQVAG